MATVAEVKKNILAYFAGLESKKIVTGQFGSYGDGTSYATAQEQLDKINAASGKFPGLTGMDYAMPGGMDSATQFLIDKWKQGYLVHASWHMPNPFTGGKASVNESSTVALNQAYDERTNVNKKFRQQLDAVATQLAKLKAAGVVVLWRPFHEMNGDWFWWKATGSNQENFKALWIYTWKYLTETKGLDNLIWCFSPNFAWDEWHSMLPSKYYPGSAYVDMVGMDKYANVSERPIKFNQFGDYTDLAKMGKPMALFEFGGIPASSEGWNAPKAVDWLAIVNDMLANYPKFILFQAWEWVWQIAADNAINVKPMMDSAKTVTLKDLPSFAGSVTPPVDPPPVDPPPVDPPPAGTILTEAQIREIVSNEWRIQAEAFEAKFLDKLAKSNWKVIPQ